MTDPKPPEFVGEVLREEPALGAPIERLPELLAPVAVSPGGLERLMNAVAEPPLRSAPFFERTFTITPDEPCVAAAVHRGIRFSSLAMRVLAKLFGD